MEKIIEWFKKSHRWLHLLIGLLIGFGATSIYCAALAGFGVAITSELKDELWGGLFDWWDFILTIVGVAMGYVIHGSILGFVCY